MPGTAQTARKSTAAKATPGSSKSNLLAKADILKLPTTERKNYVSKLSKEEKKKFVSTLSTAERKKCGLSKTEIANLFGTKPHRYRPMTVAMRAKDDSAHMPPNASMQVPEINYKKVRVTKKEVIASLEPRHSTRIQEIRKEKPDGNLDKLYSSNSSEDIKKMTAALHNALEMSKGDTRQLLSRMYKIVESTFFRISPELIASVLLDFSNDIPDELCIFDWANNDTARCVTLFQGLFFRIPGLKQAVQTEVEMKVQQFPLEDSRRAQKFAAFYAAALKEDLLLPSKSIWSNNETWSPQLGIFLANVLEEMEISIKKMPTTWNALVEAKLIEMIMLGKNFLKELEKYLASPKGVVIKDMITRTCKSNIVEMISSVMKKKVDIGVEQKLFICAQNCGIKDTEMPSLVWTGIIRNVEKCTRKSSREPTFLNIPEILAERDDLKSILQLHPQEFLNAMDFPSHLSYLDGAILPFIFSCLKRGILKNSDLVKWKQNYNEISNSKSQAILYNVNW